MNKQTSNANKARTGKADEFSLLVVEKLREIEKVRGRKFVSLQSRCDVLNRNGFLTCRNKRWSKTQMSRVLRRAVSTLGMF